MYIEKIVINGFKSYAREVVVDLFDRHFNAITGPNGSGKSNILDSICFVLGIKNLDQVRASNLQDLVYKQGQAGVTKALVSITFDNSDDKASPTGYEDKQKIIVTRQIQVPGRDKYLINGRPVEKNRVQDMFHTVQLNVNNPHFLIMQGRITKVLGMRPAEILGMLEEAAGTKMYDKKREIALKTLEKKQARLEEIDQLMQDELKPRLEKLQTERKEYVEFMKAKEELESLRHLLDAHTFWKLLRSAESNAAKIEGLQETIQELHEQREEAQMNVAAKAEELAAIKTQLEIQQQGGIRDAKAKADKLGMQLAKQKGEMESAADDEKVQSQEVAQLRTMLDTLDEERINATVEAAQEKVTASKAALQAAEGEVENAQCELSGAECGDGRDASNRSLAERLQDTEAELKQQDAEAKEAAIVVKYLKKDVEKAERDAQAKENADKQLRLDLDRHSGAVETATAAVAAVPLDEAEVKALEVSAKAEHAAVQQLRGKHSALSGQVSQYLNVSYSDPSPGFDRSTVKGVLASLVRVQQPEYATALGVAAGGKLNHIVVTTAEVGASLLKRGNLKRRVTIVPLDKTRTNVVPQPKRTEAGASTGNRARLALELIGYQEDVQAAMEYAFGSAFICDDDQAAQKVAFSRNIACRSVSVVGNDFNPSGTLTGGSLGKQAPILATLTELAAIDEQLAQHQAALDAARHKLDALKHQRQAKRAAEEKLVLAQHQLELAQQRLQSGAGHQARAHAAEVRAKLEQAEATLQGANTKSTELKELVKTLKETANALERDKGALVKAAKARLASAQKAVQSARAAFAKDEHTHLERVAERTQAATERADVQTQLQTAEAALAATTAALKEVQQHVEETQATFAAAEKEVEEAKVLLERCNEDMRIVQDEKARLDLQAVDLEKQATKAAQGAAKLKKDVEEATARIKQFERGDNQLVLQHRESFGIAGGNFDFEAMDMRAKEKQHADLQRFVEDRDGKINLSVMSTLRKAEEDYTNLEQRRHTVKADREKITTVIEELDAKKETALEVTWREVGASFGQIFTTLLPGTEAKLEPPAGASFLDGLEVNVAFGGVWKESLSELSGGQRSLLALSLVLALLKFRPAPLYILDEVDAALDLSHTQNIGRMIKEHFPHAQFIIVSLKEGMFNNANVIFRTRFVDGTSTVRRTCNTGKPASKAAPSKRQRASALQENAARKFFLNR